MKYNSINHSKYSIRYHIIFVCKYRKKLLLRLGDKIKQYSYDISNKYDFTILEMEVDVDHIHYMIESVPKLSPLMIVRVLKQQTTVLSWKNHNTYLKKHFWKEKTLWTDGYFISSIGEVSSKTLAKYIKNQG